MFVEPLINKGINHPRTGWIEVISGCMFSGKTEELIRRLNRAKIARLTTETFKPTLDKRYHHLDIVSHNKNSIPATPVQTADEILLLAGSCDVIGLDEAQFFDDTIITVTSELANQGKRVIIAGLDMDFRGNPFGPMPKLLAIAEYVTKVHAICVVCGDIASHSFRTFSSHEQVLLGEKEYYEARCRCCFNLGERVIRR